MDKIGEQCQFIYGGRVKMKLGDVNQKLDGLSKAEKMQLKNFAKSVSGKTYLGDTVLHMKGKAYIENKEESIETKEEQIIDDIERKEKAEIESKTTFDIGNNIKVKYDSNEIRVVASEDTSEYNGGIKITSGFEIALGCNIKKYKEVLSKTRLPFAIQETMSNENIKMYSLIRLGSGKVQDTVAFTLKCVDDTLVAIAMGNARNKEYRKYTKLPVIWQLGINLNSLINSNEESEYKQEVLEITSKVLPGFTWDTFSLSSGFLLKIKGRCNETDVTMSFKKTSTSGDLALLQGISIM